MQYKNFRFCVPQKFPVLALIKSFLNTSYDEVSVDVFATDDQAVECTWIFS